MSFLHYLGLLLLSCAWLWLLPLYQKPGPFWLPLVMTGLFLLSFPPDRSAPVQSGPGGSGAGAGTEAGPDMERSRESKKLGRSAALLLIPCILAIAALPRPFMLGPLVLFLAVLAGLLGAERRGGFRPVSGCILGGAVLTVQGFALPLLAVFSAHVHDVPLFGYILYPFVKLFDPSAALSSGRIFISSIEEIFGFGVSMERLAFLPLALFFIGVVVSRFSRGDALATTGRLVLAFIIYAGARLMVLLFAVAVSTRDSLFWETQSLLLSLLLLPLLLSRFAPFGPLPGRETGGAGEAAAARGGMRIRGAILLTASCFLLVGSITFHDPGRIKGGRVLFDEKYSDWEWSTRAYDRDWYGSKSGYNYYCLAEYLSRFYDVERGLQSFTPEYLDRYDIVIVKTPTRPFSGEEIEALEHYVRKGGGLFLIGDHTNVFGTSTNLNPVAARFGLRFNYDSTYQLATRALSFFVPPPILAHPLLLHVPEFFFATSCTMDAPILGENVIVGYALRGVMLDYSRRSYFPPKDERDYEFGFLMQMAGAKAGRGRVLGYTDSTVFSNFFMFIPGKPELFLGSLDWLNRTNRWGGLNIVFFLIGLAAAVAGGIYVRRAGRPEVGGILLFCMITGIVLSVHFFDALKKAAYQPPKPKRDMRTIAFDRDPSRNEMPLTSLVRRREESLHTFYVWTQRLGMFPSLHPTLKDALKASPVAVVANPGRSLSIEEIDAVVEFCRRGGNLLLIANPLDRASSSRELLGIFRMGLQPEVADTTFIMNIKGERICDAIGAGSIKGGIPLLTLPGGRVVFAYDELEKGRFFAFADFHIFSQAFMGPTSVEPQSRQREVYELEFQMLEIIMGERDPQDIRPYTGGDWDSRAPAANNNPESSSRSR